MSVGIINTCVMSWSAGKKNGGKWHFVITWDLPCVPPLSVRVIVGMTFTSAGVERGSPKTNIVFLLNLSVVEQGTQ